MGSSSTHFPPQFNLNSKAKDGFSKQIRAALEEHGCFVLKCEEHEYFRDEMVVEMEKLFSLNPETKSKHTTKADYENLAPYLAPTEYFPYYESFAIPNVRSIDEEAKKFTELMWPDGNEKFHQTLSSTNKSLFELAQIIMDIIATSYGIKNEGNSCFSSASSITRMSKYMPPLEKEEAGLALPEHVDEFYFTILCQNEVNGLKVKSKDGSWLDVNHEKGTFIVIVGELLKAWSNGKLMAPLHKVMISGNKDRYSYVFFLVPENDEVIKPHSDLVDVENPPRFKPFSYKDYRAQTAINYNREGFFEEFAGI